MSDASSSQSSIEYSIKEYFITHVEDDLTGAGIPVFFDAAAKPKDGINQWVLAVVDDIGIKKSSLSKIILTLFLHTRKDSEGYNLAILRDTIYSLLEGSHDSIDTPESMITLYDISSKEKHGALTIMFDEMREGKKLTAADGTNYKIMTILMKMASK